MKKIDIKSLQHDKIHIHAENTIKSIPLNTIDPKFDRAIIFILFSEKVGGAITINGISKGMQTGEVKNLAALPVWTEPDKIMTFVKNLYYNKTITANDIEGFKIIPQTIGDIRKGQPGTSLIFNLEKFHFDFDGIANRISIMTDDKQGTSIVMTEQELDGNHPLDNQQGGRL